MTNKIPKVLTIGYTSGTFDLFHIGHLNILRRCRDACDRLVVGVNTDDSVFLRKGKRCVMPLCERLAIIQSLKFVDEAFAKDFEDDIDLKSFHMYKYRKSFIGDDYMSDERFLRYGDALAGVGAELIFLPRTASVSTTEIMERIAELANKRQKA